MTIHNRGFKKNEIGNFALRHVTNKAVYVKEARFPPRLSEWTKNIHEAEKFEYESEALKAADFLSNYAFSVEIVSLIKKV
jgi:hypothetical protein